MTSDSEDKTTEQPPRAKPASDDTPTAVTPTGETPWQRSGGRRISVHLLVILATIFTILAVFANWTRQQLLDTNQWTKASSELIANPVIRDQLAIYLVDQLYTNVDVQAEIKSVLPTELQPLAPVAAAGARDLITKAANAALEQALSQRSGRDQRLRLCKLQRMRQKAAFVGIADGHLDRPQFIQGEPGQNKFKAIWQQQAHVVAATHPKTAQAMRQAVDGGIHLSEGMGGSSIGPGQKRTLRAVHRLVLQHKRQRPLGALKVRLEVWKGQHAGLAR